ncbi:MAG: biotin carboxylase [Deltaproteobacteria bacterium]|nr:biotin carboxylase [Deltaproteobacteria bacterium]
MFQKILVANRGEIARRVVRTARRLGVKTVAVHSDADAGALFVRDADEAVRIGPPPPRESYLNVAAILAAARDTGAQAIHPGYGFLSENAAFATEVARAGLVFIGPPPSAMNALGDKVEAKRNVSAVGVPVVPGFVGVLENEDHAVAEANRIGFPVMLKASAGGGGIGMHRCRSEADLRKNFGDARKKGEMFFGKSHVFLEKLIDRPRHVEVQIIGDAGGTVHALSERECSIQRRHQKVLEEAPSPVVDPPMRARMLEAARKAGEAAGYRNAGTVEFIVDGNTREFFFLEVNARLQVEHPITEAVMGIDLVEAQLRVAAGEPLPFDPAALRMDGHAIEARICAEDPDKRFVPSPGTISALSFPSGEGIRVDTGVESGSVVTPYYDSLLAKLICHGKDRAQACDRLVAALRQCKVEGIKTNIPLLEKVVDSEVFRSGKLHTDLLAESFGLKS